MTERDSVGFTGGLTVNPASIDANIFPMLSLAPDLKAAIRESGLKGVHAMALMKLSAKKFGEDREKAQSIRVKTTQRVAEKLPLGKRKWC